MSSTCGATATYDGSFDVPTDLVCGQEQGHDGDHSDERSEYPVTWPEGSTHWFQRGPRRTS